MNARHILQKLDDPRPLIVGLGGTTRADSSTEKVIRMVLCAAEEAGARVLQFSGPQLALPLYAPENPQRCALALTLLDALRSADGLVLGSPAYHGGISGLVKNALDYTEDMAKDSRVYFDGVPVGCVVAGAGWQGANATLSAL
ncbi:MAG TPA: NAD(P)H-dependent oxidoreductase, partial [Ramlibacter sp.]|nr:NAD(P)H-dependent oxidoreductase [Ramlibacter sp.]